MFGVKSENKFDTSFDISNLNMCIVSLDDNKTCASTSIMFFSFNCMFLKCGFVCLDMILFIIEYAEYAIYEKGCDTRVFDASSRVIKLIFCIVKDVILCVKQVKTIFKVCSSLDGFISCWLTHFGA